jgi:PAS domain-containing protein
MKKPSHQSLYNEQLFAELYDVQPQAIIWFKPVWNPDGTTIIDFDFAYGNDEALNYLELNREAFTGLCIANTPTHTDELRKATMEDLLVVCHTGKKSSSTFYNPALKKYSRVLRVKLRGGVLNVIQDITEEKDIIRQLDEQKTLVDNILTNSTNGISVSQAIRDDNGQVFDAVTVLANDAAITHTGLSREIYLSKRATELDPGIVETPYFQACVRTLETGDPFVMQYKVEYSGRWLELTVSRMNNDHLIHVFSDVTPIKEAQLRSEQAAAQLQTIINRTQLGILVLHPEQNGKGEIADFRFVLANKALAAYVHQEPETLIGELGSRWFTGLYDQRFI